MNFTSNSSQQSWSELLCCIKCKEVFTAEKVPVNLACSHLMCKVCTESEGVLCPLDKGDIKSKAEHQYVNGPILSIILGKNNVNPTSLEGTLKSHFDGHEEQQKTMENIETLLYDLANSYLCKINYEKGATISSFKISRTIQRKLLSILCANVLSAEGKGQLTTNVCSMVERIVSELILHIQSNANLSSSLWTAVRMRGCQFLGPALQSDVLKVIYCAMCQGEKLERKILVMFIVNELAQDYSHISKTCVGHVVQLLYRASCFNVIKREGQSSQMQLKEEFRKLDQLRAEHDAQIVQIAMEAGLRISADQWSSLLYGDRDHRQYMQTICARLMNDNSLKKAVEELEKIVNAQPKERNLHGISDIFEHLKAVVIDHKIESLDVKDLDWPKLENILKCASSILTYYSKYIQNRNAERQQHRQMVTLGDRTNMPMAPNQFVGGGAGAGPFEMQMQPQPFQPQQYFRPPPSHRRNNNPPRMFNNGNGMEGGGPPFGACPIPPLLPPQQQPIGNLATAPNYMMDPQQQQQMGISLIGSPPPPPANFILPPLTPHALPQMSIGGTPPPLPNTTTFITGPPQLCMTPPAPLNSISTTMLDRRDSGCGYSQPDSFETVTTLVPVLLSPLGQQQIAMPNPSSSPVPIFTNGSSIFLLGANGTTPTECTTFRGRGGRQGGGRRMIRFGQFQILIPFGQFQILIPKNTIISHYKLPNGTTAFFTPTHQPLQNGVNNPVSLFSTTPPTTYQINAGGLPPYPMQVQQPTQSVVPYGSPPAGIPFAFGTSPPLIYPAWRTSMESAAALSPNLQSLFHVPTQFYAENTTKAESSGNGRNGFKQHRSRQSPLTISHGHGGHHEDDKCHVSFIVATSVLNDDKLGGGNNSVGAASSWTLELPSGNVSIPLSPLKYTVAHVPKSMENSTTTTNLCAALSVSSLIEVVDASLMMPPPPPTSSMHHHEMKISANNNNHLSISS